MTDHRNQKNKQTNLYRFVLQPANTQLAVRTLYAINQGINGIHSFLHSLLDRINISINVKLAESVNKTKTNTTEKQSENLESKKTDEKKQ